MVGATSCMLTETKRNYDVWDREFMGFIYGLLHWRHLLVGTSMPVQVFVDHANLTHYCHPQKINRHVARYINSLSEFNYVLKHLPGTLNRAMVSPDVPTTMMGPTTTNKSLPFLIMFSFVLLLWILCGAA